jgi:hypothetical protein
VNFERQPDFMTGMAPLGEADVKFLRWAEFFRGDILAHSVDGDFIPIALIRYEQHVHCDEGQNLYNIALHRLKYKMPEEQAARKRLKTASEGGDGKQKKMPARREFEYVNVAVLHRSLQACLARLASGGGQPSSSVFGKAASPSTCPDAYMKMVATLIALCGTDFTRNLPHISPVSMWAMLHEDRNIFLGLIKAFGAQQSSFDVQQACNCIVARMYINKYSHHVRTLTSLQRQDIQAVLQCLKQGKLSDKTKKELPSAERINTTFRNINWLLQYWMCREPLPLENGEAGSWNYATCYPDPVCDEFGFKLLPKTGKVAWLDSAA